MSAASPLLRPLLAWLGMDRLPGLEQGGYLEAMVQRVPAVYCLGLAGTLAALLAAWLWAAPPLEEEEAVLEHDQEEETVCSNGSFEISPGDECEFVALSPEEDAARRPPPSQYIPLDPASPGRQVREFLARRRGEEPGEEGGEWQGEDLGRYLGPGDIGVRADPRESPSRQGSLISRVKKARQRSLRTAVERDMTADDRLKESMMVTQQMARVYTMMRENKEMFGNTSFEDVTAQMDLYKA